MVVRKVYFPKVKLTTLILTFSYFGCVGLSSTLDNDYYKRIAQLNLNGGREEGMLAKGQADNALRLKIVALAGGDFLRQN